MAGWDTCRVARPLDLRRCERAPKPSPGAVRGSWGTAGSRASSGNNYGSYESPAFDAYVDSALAAFDPAARKTYFTMAYETIIQDAPAIWLSESIPTVGYNARLNLAPLRSDAWWAHIPEWSIAADKRIPRDTGPFKAAPASAAPPTSRSHAKALTRRCWSAATMARSSPRFWPGMMATAAGFIISPSPPITAKRDMGAS